MNKKILMVAVPIFAVVAGALSAGAAVRAPVASAAAPVVHLGATANCLAHGIRITGSFTVPNGRASFGNIGVDQIGAVHLPYAATQTVSEWYRHTRYPRSPAVTQGTKVVKTTDSTTWTAQNMVTGWTAPSGDTWYAAFYEVDSVYQGSSITGRDYTDYHCTALGATPRVEQTYPTWTSVPGTGS